MYIPTLNLKISRIRIGIRIRKDQRAGFGSESEMALQVGSGSEIDRFGSATLHVRIRKYLLWREVDLNFGE